MTSPLITSETPEALKNEKGIHLLTTNTPNGQKVQILLEELAAAYGTKYSYTIIALNTNVQKSDYFLRLNPNGRIPVVIDNSVPNPPFTVHETSAQLVYLQNKLDKENKFGFADELEKSQMLQWLFFWHGSGAPYMGNLGYFKRAQEQSPFAIERFRKELYRVFGVLEIQLSGKYTGEAKDWLAGNGKGKYSIADMGTWPWVKNYPNSYSEEEMKEFPHLVQWVKRVAERSVVQAGISGDKWSLK